MYLGIYDIDGDPDELLAAYDRVMARMPEGQVYFHACPLDLSPAQREQLAAAKRRRQASVTSSRS
jgi:hypothetical protein